MSGGAPVSAPVVAVVVLEDRAQVTRRGALALPTGQHRVVIEGVAPVLVDKSVLCTAAGARVLDARCERYAAPWRAPDGDSDALVATLHTDRVTARVARAQADARLATARAESAAHDALAGAALADLALAATRGTQLRDAEARLAELDALAAGARQRRAVAELAVADATAALARLEARLARVLAATGTDAARLVIDLVVDAAGPVTLTCGYVVPGAAWRPTHRARLVRDGAAATVTWSTTACVWQATGEDWETAELAFSLERPSLGVAPPPLLDDVLRTRRRPDAITVEARDHEHQTLSPGGGAREVPGIDDGGLGLVLRAARAVTIRADGAPHRVPISEHTAPAQLALVAIPLRSPWVHLRARLSHAGAHPLLAGPVDLLLSSGYVGRAEVGLVAPGERFDVGFGPEADVRVHRDETREREDAGLLGGWSTQTVRIALRLSNLGAVPREVTLIERVPISEVEQVEIHAAPSEAYALDEPGVTQVHARQIDDQGLVTWQIALPPRGRRAVTLEYTVKSRAGVTGI